CSGRVKGDEPEKAAEVLDEVAVKGYACEANFERLRRCEQMAKQKGCMVPQIAMAWIYQQPVQTFAVVSTSKPERMQENVDALSVELTQEELAWLDLQR
ncbi:MAG: aldo/keto reductase, partial [Clostridiales bacterium]|nr:aldo/keto reductase [Clostridiales bacterium]